MGVLKSKFDCSMFYSDACNYFAANAEKYTKEQAAALNNQDPEKADVAYAWHGFCGADEYGNTRHGWNLNFQERKRGVKVWVWEAQ